MFDLTRISPVFWLEMLTTARRQRYLAIRLGYALVLFVFLWQQYEATVGRRGQTLGVGANFAASFFETFAVLQMLAVLALTPAMVAGSISIERERRTIEYLFVSRLSDAEIVWGKLGARLLAVLMQAAAGLPILSLTMLLGGIDPESLTAVFLLTGSTLLATAGISVAVSVWTPRARDAVTRTYLALFALLAVPPLLRLPFARSVGGLSVLGEWLLWPFDVAYETNPFVLLASLSQEYPTVSFAQGLISQCALAAVTATAATWGVRRIHLREGGRKGRAASPDRHRTKPPLVGRAMFWKELYAHRGMRLGWVGWIALAGLGLGLLWPLWAIVMAERSGEALVGVLMAETTVVSSLAMLAIISRAATSISGERERDTWLTLISAPVSGAEVVDAKILGNLFAWRFVAIGLLLAWFVAVLARPTLFVAMPFLVISLLVTGYWASALGVFYSLWCTSSMRSMAASLSLAIFVGGGYLTCCSPFMFGGGFSELFAAACVPFLLVAPYMLWEFSGSHYNPVAELSMAYIIGLVGYGIAGMAIRHFAVAEFDRYAGRICPRKPGK